MRLSHPAMICTIAPQSSDVAAAPIGQRERVTSLPSGTPEVLGALLRPPQRPATIDHPATSLGPLCDRGVNRDYPRVCRPSDHRKRLWDRAGEIVADPFQILYQKNYALCGNRLNLEFDLIQSSPIEHLFSVCRPARRCSR